MAQNSRRSSRRDVMATMAGLAGTASLARVAAASEGSQRKSDTAFEGDPRQLWTSPNASVTGPFVTGEHTFVISSSNQAYPNSIRILLPDHPASLRNIRVVYVLPVNPDIRYQWNDGLATFKALGLHNQYGFIAVAPSFSDWPWFANHPTNARIQQETYLLNDVLPFVDSILTWLPVFRPRTTTIKRLLLGFSKSGNGSYQLLLRNPGLFQAASIWDAPVMKLAPDQFEMPSIYGTQSNFDNYCIPTLLQANAPLLRNKPPRLALFGYSLFGGPNPPSFGGQHTEEAHELMLSLGIPHIYDNSTSRAHRWDSGWMEAAAAALNEMSMHD